MWQDATLWFNVVIYLKLFRIYIYRYTLFADLELNKLRGHIKILRTSKNNL